MLHSIIDSAQHICAFGEENTIYLSGVGTFSTYSGGQAQRVPPPPGRVELFLLANGNLCLADLTRIGVDGYPDAADVSMPYRPFRGL